MRTVSLFLPSGPPSVQPLCGWSSGCAGPPLPIVLSPGMHGTTLISAYHSLSTHLLSSASDVSLLEE